VNNRIHTIFGSFTMSKQNTEATIGAITPEISRIFASVKDAADVLSVSKGTVYGLMRDGLLEYRKLGARRVVPIAALQAYAAGLGK
jgi:excisionase family DNA binding protein